MATKAELREIARELAAKLGERVDLSRGNHAQLTDLVTELRAKIEAHSQGIVAPPPPEEAPPPPKRVAHPLPPGAPLVSKPTPVVAVGIQRQQPLSEYVVAPGRSVTSRRGMLHEGKPVRSTDFDDDVLARLVSVGAITKRNS